MIKKITIAIISTLLSASILSTMVSPLIPGALDIYLRDREQITNNLIIFGLIISFVLATILVIICVPWKEKHEEDENTRKSEILKEFVELCEEKATMSKTLEALNDLKEIRGWNDEEYYKRLDIIEKPLQALEIIKERFTIQFIKSDFLPNYYGIMQIGTNPIYIKTREEFDLLSEVLL